MEMIFICVTTAASAIISAIQLGLIVNQTIQQTARTYPKNESLQEKETPHRSHSEKTPQKITSDIKENPQVSPNEKPPKPRRRIIDGMQIDLNNYESITPTLEWLSDERRV